MKRQRHLILAILMATIFSGGLVAQSEPVAGEQPKALVPFRGWQFHVPKVDYIRGAMAKAHEYDVNTVVFSHEIIGYVSELYRGDEAAERAKMLRELSKEARGLGLKSLIWVRELERDVPDEFMADGKVQLDKEGFWPWLQGKYEKLFKDFPEFDGVILTFHETPFRIFDRNRIASELSMPERFTKLINTIDAACAPLGKELIVRSFLYEPQQLEWFAEGIKGVDKRVILQAKCEPHDWQPFYPHEPMIGKYPDRPLIVEFDCSSEFTGRNRVPWAAPDYFEHRWRYDLSQPGVMGYNARLDHAGYDALYTPNEINIYSLYRMTQDKDIDADAIWKEWTEKRYGKEAAPHVEAALRPTFDSLNKSFFILEFWITNHSAVPNYNYANGHISSRTIAKWKPDEPRYAELERRLNHPDPEILEQILKEKDEAIALQEQSLVALEKAKPHLSQDQYSDLEWRLKMLRRVGTIWKLHSQAFFGYKTLAEGHRSPELEARVAEAIEGMLKEAEISEAAGERRGPPVGASEIRRAANELKERLDNLKAGRTASETKGKSRENSEE